MTGERLGERRAVRFGEFASSELIRHDSRQCSVNTRCPLSVKRTINRDMSINTA
jgi:hypothetical protein